MNHYCGQNNKWTHGYTYMSKLIKLYMLNVSF